MRNRRLLGVLMAATAVGAIVLLIRLWPVDRSQGGDNLAQARPSNPLIQLTPAKLARARLVVEPVVLQSVRPTVRVSGRVRYDESRRISIRAGTGGTVNSVAVKPGDRVTRGDVLAVLDCPDVASARSDVLQRQADLELARERLHWHQQISEGIASLIKAIQAGAAVEELEDRFASTTLGQYGGELISHYSELRLAETTIDNSLPLANDGALSGRLIRERQSDRSRAAAGLQALIEQTRFDLDQARQKAAAEVSDAERRLRVSRGRLATMIGGTLDDQVGIDVSPNEVDLSRLERRSPIDGTIESRAFTTSERFSANDELFVVADTSRLWVESDIRGGDWQALTAQPGDQLTVTTPSLPDRSWTAEVHYVGRVVDPITRAIPLVATVDNQSGELKPGMYTRIEVPSGPAETLMVVSDSAIVDLDGVASVFVQQESGFLPQSIVRGRSFDNLVEVVEGLRAGDQVVTGGAFVLKGELLLEEED